MDEILSGAAVIRSCLLAIDVYTLRMFSACLYFNVQVLPERTHPATSMDGHGGYLLTATTVKKL